MNTKDLTEKELIAKLIETSKKETLALADMLLLLGELDERRLYLELGYSSCYVYCTDALKYSDGGANRRIIAARPIRKYPNLYEMLQSGELSLAVICVFARVATPQNILEITSRVKYKTQKQAEQELLDLMSPKPIKRESVKAVPVTVKKPNQENSLSLFHRQNGGGFNRDNSEPIADEPKEIRYEVKFSLNKESYEKLQKARAMCGKGKSIEALFDALIDEYLEKRTHKKERKASERNTRYIPIATRNEVFKKDAYQCSYVGSDGVRCGSKEGLEIDHIEPFAIGGSNSAENLRCLCSAHNKLAAKKIYGEDFMAQFC